MDNLLHLFFVLFLVLLPQVLSGLPEIDLQWLWPVTKGMRILELLNAFLGSLHVLEIGVPFFAVRRCLPFEEVVDQLDRLHFAHLLHLFFELLLGHILWDVHDENVTIVALLVLLLNGACELVFADVLGDKESLAFHLLFVVELLNRLLGVLVVLEVHVALVLFTLHLQVVDGAELSEQLLQIFQRKTRRNVLHKQVREIVRVFGTLRLWSQDVDVDCYAHVGSAIHLSDRLGSLFSLLELNETESLALAIRMLFQFGGANGAEGLEHFEQLALVDVLV